MGPHHYGVRFGDHRRLRATLDGKRVNDVLEVWCGTPGFGPGYAIVWRKPLHKCTCGDSICVTVAWGNYGVEGNTAEEQERRQTNEARLAHWKATGEG